MIIHVRIHINISIVQNVVHVLVANRVAGNKMWKSKKVSKATRVQKWNKMQTYSKI